MSERLGEIIGCKDKTSFWHLIGLPDSSKIGSTVSYRGETNRYILHLHQSPSRDTKKKTKGKISPNIAHICYTGSRIGWVLALLYYYITSHQESYTLARKETKLLSDNYLINLTT